jgi:hypothetical protein
MLKKNIGRWRMFGYFNKEAATGSCARGHGVPIRFFQNRVEFVDFDGNITNLIDNGDGTHTKWQDFDFESKTQISLFIYKDTMFREYEFKQ